MSVLEAVSFPTVVPFAPPPKLPGTTINSPTSKSCGSNSGFAISSAVTVVPNFAAIESNVSPDSTMYSPVGVVMFDGDGEVVELKVDVPLLRDGDVVELRVEVPLSKRVERLGDDDLNSCRIPYKQQMKPIFIMKDVDC